MNNNSLSASSIAGNYPSASLTGSNNLLLSGSKHNIRWEVAGVNPRKGTFNLVIRQGNDTHKRKQIFKTNRIFFNI